eukprot:3345903-Amphidinium_carterae.1
MPPSHPTHTQARQSLGTVGLGFAVQDSGVGQDFRDWAVTRDIRADPAEPSRLQEQHMIFKQ